MKIMPLTNNKINNRQLKKQNAQFGMHLNLGNDAADTLVEEMLPLRGFQKILVKGVEGLKLENGKEVFVNFLGNLEERTLKLVGTVLGEDRKVIIENFNGNSNNFHKILLSINNMFDA